MMFKLWNSRTKQWIDYEYIALMYSKIYIFSNENDHFYTYTGFCVLEEEAQIFNDDEIFSASYTGLKIKETKKKFIHVII